MENIKTFFGNPYYLMTVVLAIAAFGFAASAIISLIQERHQKKEADRLNDPEKQTDSEALEKKLGVDSRKLRKFLRGNEKKSNLKPQETTERSVEENEIHSEITEKVFSAKKPKSPILSELEAIFKDQGEPEARDLYGSLEAYTKHSFLTLEGQSTLSTSSRFVAFGMKNIPELMWEPLMITIMHVLTQRFSYNVDQQRATHFIVDEAQYVCRHEKSCNELEKAYLTYRKLGGICTICLQNVSAATANGKIMEIVSNSDFKVLLDQAGDDRNELLQIMDLSQKEFDALSDPTPGQCLIVWGGHILQCDSTISRDNPLYHFYSTNFHEAAAAKRNVFYHPEEKVPLTESVSIIDTDSVVSSPETTAEVELLHGDVEETLSEQETLMFQKVRDADECDEWLDCYGAGILCNMTHKEADVILESLCRKGYIEKIQGCYHIPEE